jgi:adenine-specific DNA methylase
MTLEALRRMGLDVLLVVGLGAAVVLLKQRLIHRNRQPLI